MAKLTVVLIGSSQLARQLGRSGDKIKRRVNRSLDKAALVVAGEIQQQMGGSRTRARRKGRAVTARPEQLGIDTGRLRQSIGSKRAPGVFRRGETIFGGAFVEAGTAVVYAPIHEFGGKAGRNRSVTIPARPFFLPGIKKARPAVEAILGEVLRVRF